MLEEIDMEKVYKQNPELKQNEVNILEQWVEKQEHLPNISELQAALFLHSCYYKQEAAKAAIDVYFTVRTLCPDIFQFRSYKEPGIQTTVHHSFLAVLPMPNGDTAILIQNGDIEYFTIVNYLKVFDAVLQLYLHQNGPSQGLHIIADMQKFTFSHFLKLSASIMILKKFFYILQEGLPVRMKSLQYFNVVPFMDKVLALVKPFLKKTLLESLVLHPSIDTVYDYIPQQVFPKEYGGAAESIEVLRENIARLLKENEEFLNTADRQLVDESKRTGPPNNVNEIFGVEGSFKKLEVD